MTKNMGTVDRILRLTLAIAVAVLILTGILSGVTAIILGILAVVFLATSFMSFCPLYAPFKISTIEEK